MLKDAQIREKYNTKVYNRFQSLNVEELPNLEEELKGVKTALTEAEKNTVPVKQRKAKQSWITSEILRHDG